MSLTQVTPNTGLAITLADAKDHLGIPQADTSSDAEITNLIKSARDLIERETDRVLLTETWKETLDCFPLVPIWPLQPAYRSWPLYRNPLLKYQQEVALRLRLGPVQSVTSITYYDTANQQQTLDPSTYYVITPTSLPATVTPASVWPGTFPRPDAVAVTYSVGYSSVPERVKQAVRALVATWFLYRESESEKSTKELNAGLQRILDNIKGDL